MGLRFISAVCRGIVETITGAVKHTAVGPTLHIAHGLGDRAEMACNRTANVIPEGVNASNHENAHTTIPTLVQVQGEGQGSSTLWIPRLSKIAPVTQDCQVGGEAQGIGHSFL